jgi:predicted Zn-dependent protease
LLHEAGFNPDAMPRFFEKLWKKTQYYGQQMPEYLQTHPLTTARIADSRARANQWPFQPSPPNLTFLLIQAKIRAENFSDRQEAATYFNHMRKKNPTGPEFIASAYGRGISELKWGEPKKALTFLEKLKNQLPQELLIQSAYAQSLYDAGQTNQAFRFLNRTLSRHPSDLALTLQYNEWLLNQKKAKSAIQSLRQYQLRYGETSETLEMLSKAYALLPDNTQMHLTQARYLMSVGDNRGALKQLNSAKQKISKNSKVALQIDAQTEEIKRIIEEVEGRPLKTL